MRCNLDNVVKKFSLCLFLAAVTPMAVAVPIHVDAMADVSQLSPFFPNYISLGTTVTVSVDFDIGPGAWNTAAKSGGSGTATWSDGGLQTFSITSIGPGGGANNTGIITFFFTGVGPTIGGDTADGLNLQFDVGENPFTSTTELSDLILNSSLSGLILRVNRPAVVNAPIVLGDNVSSSIMRVPEPPMLFLFGIGIAAALHRRRSVLFLRG